MNTSVSVILNAILVFIAVILQEVSEKNVHVQVIMAKERQHDGTWVISIGDRIKRVLFIIKHLSTDLGYLQQDTKRLALLYM